MSRLSRLRRLRLSPRVYWSVADQAFSSVSNLAFVVVVARSVGVEAFGEFAIAYLLYALLLGSLRAVGGEILLLRSREAREETRVDCARLLGLSLRAGLLAGLVAAPAGLVIGGVLGNSLAAFALVLPILLTQDALRYCLFALETPARAAGNDLIWLLVQALVTSAVLLLGDITPVKAILAWAAGAAVATIVGLRQAALVPARRDVTSWISEDRARVGGFFGDFSLQIGAGYLAISLVALIDGVRGVAGVRGAMIMFAPLDSLFAGVRIFTLPALADALRSGRRALIGRAGVVAVASAALSAAWAVVILSLPRSVGTSLLGNTWDVARPLCAAIAVASAARYVALPAEAALRALNDPRRIVMLRATVTTAVLGAVAVGAAEAGARGAVIGLAGAHGLGAVLWAAGFLRSSRSLAEPRQPTA
jgi:O-antigen/teichoic acid export membrane protein